MERSKTGPKPINIKMGFFSPIVDPEVAYLLGFLWADGYLFKTVKGRARVGVECLSEDMKEIDHIFSFVGIWGTQHRHRKGRRPQTVKNCSSHALFDFLENLGYSEKSGGSHEKILSSLPKELIPFWLRGYFDGDGNLYLFKDCVGGQVTFSSCYSQDWNALKDFLISKGFNVRIEHRKAKNGNKSGALRLVGYENIMRFLNYIYDPEPSIGLARKKKKYLELKSRVRKHIVRS